MDQPGPIEPRIAHVPPISVVHTNHTQPGPAHLSQVSLGQRTWPQPSPAQASSSPLSSAQLSSAHPAQLTPVQPSAPSSAQVCLAQVSPAQDSSAQLASPAHLSPPRSGQRMWPQASLISSPVQGQLSATFPLTLGWRPLCWQVHTQPTARPVRDRCPQP